MSWWRDIIRQSIFLCFFIVPIPIGAYTIHNGSSATVAVISYALLSLGIPFAYLSRPEAVFGRQEYTLSRNAFVGVWIIVVILLSIIAWSQRSMWQTLPFWEWSTIGRDIVWIVVMYGGVVGMLIVTYLLSRRGKG